MTSTAEPRAEPRETDPSRLRRAFRALGYRDFRILWLGAFLSTTGTWMQTIAQSWVVLDMTGSAFYLGVDAFLATLPMILFSLIGGAIADRIDRRRILIASQVMQMSFAFVLAALIFTGVVKVWHIFILSFLTGSAQAFGGPAYQALLPLLVNRDDVPGAVAMNSLQFNLARMIGPVLAGVALATVGAAGCFLLNGLSFVAVIISLVIIKTGAFTMAKRGASMLSDIREGFRFVEHNRAIFLLTFLAFATTFFGIPLVTLMPAVAKSIFGLGATGYSWLMTASGAGSVIGAVFVAGHVFRKGAGRTSIFFLAAFAVLLLAFALIRWLPLNAVLVFATGFALLGVITTVSSLVQLATSEQMRGRVMSIFMLAFRGGMPLGNLASGWVAERWSVPAALVVNAVCLLAVAAGFLFTRNEVRDM